MGVTVRFAPSPTGRLHAGNIRTALFNYLYARKTGGSLILRLDDTDTERSTAEFARGIEEDLHWLGIDWAKQVRQSDRFALYAAAVEKLKASGRLYPAYETPEELELKRKRQLARGKPPVYDRAALKLTEEQKAKLEAEGRRPHWRFELEQRDVRRLQHVAAGIKDEIRRRLGVGTVVRFLAEPRQQRRVELHARDVGNVARDLAETFNPGPALLRRFILLPRHGDPRHAEKKARIDPVVAGLDAFARQHAGIRPFA